MNINTQYNSPANRVRVSFSVFNVDDEDKQFRIGLVGSGMPAGTIRWHVEPQEWKTADELKDIEFILKREDEDTIVVEKKRVDDEVVEDRTKVEIQRNWPAEAHGASSTDRSYTF